MWIYLEMLVEILWMVMIDDWLGLYMLLRVRK